MIADFAAPTVPLTQRIYTNSEDGLYGPAIDNNFATNKWIYLFYSPQTVTDVKLSTGEIVTQTTPTTAPPVTSPTKAAFDPWVGYFQLSRFKFVEDASGPRLDLNSEQQIMRVPVNRQECCHVAGDIDFDKHNNMWLVTGDDTPAGGILGRQMGPFNDQLTDEQQTVLARGATAGTFTLTFKGETTAALPFDATAAQIDTALEALSTVGANGVQVTGGPVNSTNTNINTTVHFRRALQQADQPQLTGDGAGLTGATLAIATTQEGGWFQRPSGDARRSALNTNDLRGKLLRIRVKDTDISAAEANKANFGSGAGAYSIPAGNLFPLVAGAPQDKTRAEVYAMGFRNPFRVQVDENDVAYISDYSPDANSPLRGRGPAGVGRFEIVRKPSNYGWPVCYSTKLGYFAVNHTEWGPTVPLTPAPNANNTAGIPLHDPPQLWTNCAGATPTNDSRWNLEGGPTVEIGRRELPPITDPDVWYSYNDNNANNPLRHAVSGLYATDGRTVGAGVDHRVPTAVPGAVHGRRRPAWDREVQLRPEQPEPEEVPALLRRVGDPGRVHPGHAARGEAGLAEPDPEDQSVPGLRRVRLDDVPLRGAMADGHAVRRRRRVLPADIR